MSIPFAGEMHRGDLATCWRASAAERIRLVEFGLFVASMPALQLYGRRRGRWACRQVVRRVVATGNLPVSGPDRQGNVWESSVCGDYQSLSACRRWSSKRQKSLSRQAVQETSLSGSCLENGRIAPFWRV